MTKKVCYKCKKELSNSTDLFFGGGGLYCDNNKCNRYGFITVIYFNYAEVTLSEKKVGKGVKI